MTMMMACVPGVLSEVGTRLSGPSFLRNLAAMQRAQVTSRVTALAADGQSWVEYDADVPRFSGPPRRLLIEAQRTSGLRNPRCEGLVPGRIGSGAVLPTHWVLGTINGCTVDIAAAAESGLSAIDVLITPTDAGGGRIQFDAPAVTALTAYTASLFCRVVTGSMASLSALTLRMVELPSTTIGTTANMLTATSAALGSQRFQVSRSTDGTATNQRVEIVWNATGAAAPVTLRFAAPQHEAGAFASTPILPPVGTPGASTRGADLVSASLASLGIGTNGACTVLWSGVLPQVLGTASQALFQLDGGADANRFLVFNPAGSSSIAALRSTSGVNASAPLAGTVTPGVPFRAGVTVDGAGRMAISLGGGTTQSVTGGPTTGLTTLRLGNTAASTAAMFGETGSFLVLPYALSDTDLATRVTVFPAS